MSLKFQDEQSIERYNQQMLQYRDDSITHPLLPGVTFFLTINRPVQVQIQARTRHIPDIPYDHECCFQLVQPLQRQDHNINSQAQVWLAKAKTPVADSNVLVVFKFIIPSTLPLPTPDDVRYLRWYYPHDMADCQMRAYTDLHDLQGRSIPWFLGRFEVTMPWTEQAHLLVLEYIPESFSNWKRTIALDQSIESKFRDARDYFKLYISTFNVLNTAHKRNIFHLDIHEDNLLFDADNDYVVFIDWSNDLSLGNRPRKFSAQLDRWGLTMCFSRCAHDFGFGEQFDTRIRRNKRLREYIGREI